MPKAKTRKAAAKRFKATGSGKIKRGRAYKGHLLECKTSKAKRQLRKKGLVSHANLKAVKRMLPGI